MSNMPLARPAPEKSIDDLPIGSIILDHRGYALQRVLTGNWASVNAGIYSAEELRTNGAEYSIILDQSSNNI